MKLIPLTQGYFSKVDDEDFEWLSKYKWQYHAGYAKRGKYNEDKKNNDTVKMHREIMQPPAGMVVHHKNHDTLDNRKENLIVTTQAMNTKSQRNSDSKRAKHGSVYQGVIVRKRGNGSISYIASLKVNYRKVWVGAFQSELAAAAAYNQTAKKYFGEFAVLNDVPEDTYIPTSEERKAIRFANLNLSSRKKNKQQT